MYHAHRYSRSAWAGEPEIDPTLDYEEREQIEGWEMTPYECLDLAYGGVLRERFVQAGEKIWAGLSLDIDLTHGRFEHGVSDQSQCIIRSTSCCQVSPSSPPAKSLSILPVLV